MSGRLPAALSQYVPAIIAILLARAVAVMVRAHRAGTAVGSTAAIRQRRNVTGAPVVAALLVLGLWNPAPD